MEKSYLYVVRSEDGALITTYVAISPPPALDDIIQLRIDSELSAFQVLQVCPQGMWDGLYAVELTVKPVLP
jgi:hypothetical protein